MGRTSNDSLTATIAVAVVVGVLWWGFVGTVWQFTPIAIAAMCGLMLTGYLRPVKKGKRGK